MIEKIDIGNFGTFQGYEWKNVGYDYTSAFKALNIIYGRNYSGKTTLSRVFQCIENKELHPDYLNAQFNLTLNDGTEITQDNFVYNESITMRVYNTDFVKSNLSWFFNEDGSILPFTVLGKKNVEIEKEISSIEEELGSIDSKQGLYFDYGQLNDRYNAESKEMQKKTKELNDLLRKKAQSIKRNSEIYNVPNYIITSIRSDLEKIEEESTDSFILDADIKHLKNRQLKEEAKELLPQVPYFKQDLSQLIETTNNLISKKITPSDPIQELINDSLLQEWVRDGIKHHKEKRETCGFCGSSLNDELWNQLDKHFNEESEELRSEIISHIRKLMKFRKEVEKHINLEKDSFYVEIYSEYDELIKKIKSLEKEISHYLEYLAMELEKRENNIFSTSSPLFKPEEDLVGEYNTLIGALNSIINSNNYKTENLKSDQEEARVKLRFDEVANFFKDIQYERLKKDIVEQEERAEQILPFVKDKHEEIDKLEQRKFYLDNQLMDEKRAKELVNSHLSDFFGHDELALEAEGEKPNIKFKITRNGVEAKNLSEGECSLISFCYFMARIEDELKSASGKEKLIVYIDDPISSLDGNHIFYMFSLIESIIAKRKSYLQMFISTHNLDFLKYLKRLTMPDGEDNVNYFLIERRMKQSDSRSFLVKMPHHLKEYVTEFNYLFSEIYSHYEEVRGDRKRRLENTFNQFYNLPNNIRKFLEYYLFFKYPNSSSPLANLPNMFDSNVPVLLNRVINEYSHLVHIDRGWKPVDVDEMERCVSIIIDKMKEIDPEQFNSLLESIGKSRDKIEVG